MNGDQALLAFFCAIMSALCLVLSVTMAGTFYNNWSMINACEKPLTREESCVLVAVPETEVNENE